MYLGLRDIHKKPHCVVYHLIITFIFNTSITASIVYSNTSISSQLSSATSNTARPAISNRATIFINQFSSNINISPTMPSSTSSNKASYGTIQSGKSQLPFYNTLSRSSTSSTTSTDALLHKEPKKTSSKPASTKSIMDTAHKNAFKMSM